jgi:uncharacterized membrane protein YGL010W
MRHVDQLFERYGESHRNSENKAIHWICVPLITWSVLAALWAWSRLRATGSENRAAIHSDLVLCSVCNFTR